MLFPVSNEPRKNKNVIDAFRIINSICFKQTPSIRNTRFSDFITWPKNFVFGQVLFSSACMCLCVCVCVSLLVDYLKKFSTDFDET